MAIWYNQGTLRLGVRFMPDIKVCPSCGAEYFSHIKTCHHCEIELVAPEKLEEARMNLPKAEGQLVQIIEDGSFERVKSLAAGLETFGIEAKALKLSGNSCKTGAYGIFVPETQADPAMQSLQRIWKELYPESKESVASLEKMNDDLCPACGAVLTAMTIECPDCGLNLGGGSSGGSDCGDKGCGGNC